MENTAEAMKARRDVVLATDVDARDDGLSITTPDGVYFIPWEECSDSLASASDLQRRALRKSPSGYGIHWPLIDEDLAVGALVKGRGKDD